VIVEDAPRREANSIFGAVDRFEKREDVTFLLDARESDWLDMPREFDEPESLRVHSMPDLITADCEALLTLAEETLGESPAISADVLYSEVRESASARGGAEPGELLLVLHRIANRVDPLSGAETRLEAEVRSLCKDVAKDDRFLSVALLANAINASGLGIDPGLLYAVAPGEEFETVDESLDHLEGSVVFSGTDDGYRSVHEAWSVAFLNHVLETEPDDRIRTLFGEAVTALLGLAGRPERRERIAAHLGTWEHRVWIEQAPATWAEETMAAVYALGREWPKLAASSGRVPIQPCVSRRCAIPKLKQNG